MKKLSWLAVLVALVVVGLLAFFESGKGRATPTEPTPQSKPTISETAAARPEVTVVYDLPKLAKRWMATELKWQDDPRARKARDAAREVFTTALAHESRDGDVLADVPRLLSIFDGVFPYSDRTGTWNPVHDPDNPPRCAVPADYDPATAYRAVLVLRGRSHPGAVWWPDSKAYLESTWGGTDSRTDTIFILPHQFAGEDYDWLGSDDSDSRRDQLKRHVRATLGAFGEVQRTYRLDRRRMLLDCGRGTSGFGLRLAVYFPSRFAGIILREPVVPTELRLQSLIGLPILLIASDKTRAACETIRAALDQGHRTGVEILDAKDAPIGNGEVDAWMRRRIRPDFPTEVHIAPGDDRFHKSHWVEIVFCDPLDSGRDKQPSLHVVADRETNTIRITSANIAEIGLHLNDSLVDLDRAVTFHVNGRELPGMKFERSFRTLGTFLQRSYDPTALYTVYHRLLIPDG